MSLRGSHWDEEVLLRVNGVELSVLRVHRHDVLEVSIERLVAASRSDDARGAGELIAYIDGLVEGLQKAREAVAARRDTALGK